MVVNTKAHFDIYGYFCVNLFILHCYWSNLTSLSNLTLIVKRIRGLISSDFYDSAISYCLVNVN